MQTLPLSVKHNNIIIFYNYLRVLSLYSGQSYRHFTIINYNSRVVMWGIFKPGTTLKS